LENIVTNTEYNPERFDPTVLDLPLRREWEHFAGFGWSDQRIADRLGLKTNTLQKLKERAS
jgi:hypothetical protein